MRCAYSAEPSVLPLSITSTRCGKNACRIKRARHSSSKLPLFQLTIMTVTAGGAITDLADELTPALSSSRLRCTPGYYSTFSFLRAEQLTFKWQSWEKVHFLGERT